MRLLLLLPRCALLLPSLFCSFFFFSFFVAAFAFVSVSMAVFDFMWHTFQRSPRHIAKQQAAAAAAAGKTSASGSLGFAWCSVIGSLHYLVTFDVDAKYFSIATTTATATERE